MGWSATRGHVPPLPKPLERRHSWVLVDRRVRHGGHEGTRRIRAREGHFPGKTPAGV